MGKRPGSPLLMLVVVIIANYAPFPPPGSEPLGSGKFKRATCPDCGRKAPPRPGGRFYCSKCDDYFLPEGEEISTSGEDI
jgi:hypothetical protein